MARKLKSDRILFLTTILLVAISIVMVYSASAVIADERYGQPYFFLIKQLMWAILGVALLGAVMRIDYRNYREPVFIWSCFGVVCLALVAVLFSPPFRRAPMVLNRRPRDSAVGAGEAQRDRLIAALLERRMHRINEITYALAPISPRRGHLRRFDSGWSLISAPPCPWR
jgi:hypothetical protein